MLSQQQEFALNESDELYDKVVPKDNLLRRINNLVDFSFVYQELVDKYCNNNGRAAESPIRMFKYLFLKTIYDISDVDVVERSRYDMSFKYFLGMTPYEDVINPSSLCKFRKLRLKDTDLLNLLIKKTIDIAVEKGLIKSKTIIVDATHTRARSNPYSPVEILKLRSKQLRKALYDMDESIKDKLPAKNEDDDLVHELDYTKELLKYAESDESLASVPAVKQRLNMLKETREDIEDHYTSSKDKDARIGHKSKNKSYFGYKSHLAMNTSRIITAAKFTSGEKGDGLQLNELVEQSRKNGMEVDKVIGDAAYSGTENLKLAEDPEKGFTLVSKLNPVISYGNRTKDNLFDYNKDAAMFVCPAGHMAIKKARQNLNKGNKNSRWVYYFDVEKCKTCSRREGCYKNGAKRKTYTVQIRKDEQQRQFEFQQTQEFKDTARQRYMIEAKNAELKQVYGYDRAKSYGLDCMVMQGALTIFVANIKRILKLM